MDEIADTARSEEASVNEHDEEVELGATDAVSFCRATYEDGITVQETDSSMPMLVGKFAHYDGWNEIRSRSEARDMGLRGDRYMERVLPGAFTKTLQERAKQIRILFNHGTDPAIGKKPLGEIVSVREEQDGPHYEVKLFDVSYVRDLLPALRAEQFGSSYRSDLVKGRLKRRPGESDHNPEGLPEATVAEIKMKEFGPVTFPAESKATAGIRSLTDWVESEDLGLQLRRFLHEEPIVSEPEAATLLEDEDEQPVERAEGETDSHVEPVRATAVYLGSRSTRRQSDDYLSIEEVRPKWHL